jgi:hypothetical protein
MIKYLANYGPSFRDIALIALGFGILYAGSDAVGFPRLCVIFTAIALPMVIAVLLREGDRSKGWD